jgi:hypothetical protein
MSIFRLRWGGKSGRIGIEKITYPVEPLPPSVGALVFLGFGFSPAVTSKK